MMCGGSSSENPLLVCVDIENTTNIVSYPNNIPKGLDLLAFRDSQFIINGGQNPAALYPDQTLTSTTVLILSIQPIVFCA